MGAETNGPSEEDVKIRKEAGEPEERTRDINLAQGRANLSEKYRKGKETYLAGHEKFRTQHPDIAPDKDSVRKTDDQAGFGKMSQMAEEGELDHELEDK